MPRRKKQVQWLRTARKIHRATGALLFVFFFIIAATGLLLGWKKHSGGLILPKSYKGTSTELRDWQSFDSLHAVAMRVLRDSIGSDLSAKLARIDARPDKGMVKFVFEDHYWGIQLDATTGEVLHIERRVSDFIENVHDGSILDFLTKTDDGQIKLVYTTIMGLALLTFTVTGFWLWYGPKRMKQNTANRKALTQE